MIVHYESKTNELTAEEIKELEELEKRPEETEELSPKLYKALECAAKERNRHLSIKDKKRA